MVKVFRHYIAKPFLYLALIESLLLFASIYSGTYIHFHNSLEPAYKLYPTFSIAITFSITMVSSMIAMGLHEQHLREGMWGVFLRICGSFIIGFFIMSILFYMLPEFSLGRGTFAVSLITGFFYILTSRLIFSLAVNQDTLKRRILIVGSGKKAALINSSLRRQSDRRDFVIIGYVHFPFEHSVIKENIIPHDDTLCELANKYAIDELVIALDDRRNIFPMEEIVNCRLQGIDVFDLMSFFERQTGKLPLNLIQPSWLAYSEGFYNHASRAYIKRAFDILVSLIILTASLPAIIGAAIAIRLGEKGNIFYLQERVGLNGEKFFIVKFRSMSVNAEEDGIAVWAKDNDNRITPIGALIRKSRIDELPQIINVLKGEMSFVGPRPERPEFVGQLSEKFPYYNDRHRAKPGITGWAQVSYPYGASEHDSAEKLQYDLYYVKNYSLFLDLMILIKTVHVVLWGKGAR